MATRQKKTARRQRRKTQQRESNRALDFRGFQLRASSVNEEDRTVEAVIASETPVDELDYERFEVVPRILLGEGAAIPNQVPLLDSHDRTSTRNQLGSIRNLRQEGGSVIGTLHFSSLSGEQFTKVREGHITDVSAGFSVDEEEYIEAGKTKNIRGREFTGPLNVATKWSLREGSLVPIGADEAAKLRGLDPTRLPPKTRFTMNDKLKALLIARGMPADLSDDDAQAWMVTDEEKRIADDATRMEAEAEAKRNADKAKKPEPENAEARLRLYVKEEADRREKERAENRQHVNDQCDLADLTPRAEWYDLDREALSTAIKGAKKERQVDVGPRFSMADSQPRDRGLAALGTAINMRSLADSPVSGNLDKIYPEAERAKGAEDFQYASFLDMARESLMLDGHSYRELQRLSREQLAQAALGFTKDLNLRSDPAFHTTSSFLKLTMDAVNKSLRGAYTEAPSTWKGPMRQGSSTPDFKTIHRIVLGAVPNLPFWSGNVDPEQATIADAEETYAVECRSVHIGLSYKLLVNDDMSALGRIPGQLGQAAARTVNAAAWSIITGNPAMRDGKDLFNAVSDPRFRLNLTTGTAAPTATNVQVLAGLMMQMRGENTPAGTESDDVLAITPRYIVGPGALKTVIEQLVFSIADNSKSNDITYNPWRGLVPVIEPLLDADSALSWYLFADPSQIDTVEVTFLQGQETPAVRSFTDDKTLSQNYIVLQTFGAKALDWRGVQKNVGA